jgi:hypothetical protein
MVKRDRTTKIIFKKPHPIIANTSVKKANRAMTG